MFVIRVAGNVIDDHQLGSIEYAAEHLGTNLVVMMGHTGCGAVDAAIHHDPSGFIKYITDEIRNAIGEETDPYRATCLNVEHGVNYPPPTHTLRGGGFVPLTRTQGRHLPAVPFHRDYFCDSSDPHSGYLYRS